MPSNNKEIEEKLQSIERELSSLRANIGDIEFIKDPSSKIQQFRDLFNEKNKEFQEAVNLFKSQQAQMQALQGNMHASEYGIANSYSQFQQLQQEMDKKLAQISQFSNELDQHRIKLAEFKSSEYIRYAELFSEKTRLKQEQQEISIQHQTTSAFNLAKNMRTLLQQQPEWYKQFVLRCGFKLAENSDSDPTKKLEFFTKDDAIPITIDDRSVIYNGEITKENMYKIVVPLLLFYLKSIEGYQ